MRREKIKSHRGYEITLFGDFRGISVYTLTLDEKMQKKRLEKALKRSIGFLSRSGTVLLGAPSCAGIAGVVTERELLLDLRARFAEAFSEVSGLNCDFLLVGGIMRRRIEAAVHLLKKRRTVYLSCADFEESSERIFELTGATVGENPPGKFIAVNLSEVDEILRVGERKVVFSDFRLTLPWDKATEMPAEELSVLASMLEICGVLRKKEIKVECFIK